jgi:hypothetical protein
MADEVMPHGVHAGPPITAVIGDLTQEPSRAKFVKLLGGELYGRAIHSRAKFVATLIVRQAQVLVPLAALQDLAAFMMVLIEISTVAPDALRVIDLLAPATVEELQAMLAADALARSEPQGSA